MKKLSNEIRLRIKEYKKNKKAFTVREQIAALLVRNETFQSESRSGPVEGCFFDGSPALELFCHRWHINSRWDGKDDTLAEFIDMTVHIFSKSEWGTGKRDPYDGVWALNLGQVMSNYIYLRIDPWTAKKDIGSQWREIEKLQKECYGEIFGKKHETFCRDLCWYDLYKRNGKTENEIANIWKEDPELKIDVKNLFDKRKKQWNTLDEYIENPGDNRRGFTPFEEAINRAILRIAKSVKLIEQYAIKFHYSVNF
jgi:hypothetical protein